MMTKAILTEDEMPRQWYNLAADLPGPLQPPRGPDGKPVTPEQLAAVFPMNLIEQEMSSERWIDIPEEVLAILFKWRPSPLQRAYGLEKALKTPARIYFKNESLSPAGSHKPNTAVAQAYYNKAAGIKRLTTETGAGQWGSALAFACAQFGLECKVYMVKSSYEQKPYRKYMMQTWGGTCVPSPSDTTEAGRAVLRDDPKSPGSLGIAISEAVEEAVSDSTGQTRYALGSVLNHVMLHQTIIGLEAQKQLAKFGEKKVDTIVACVGGGSNFAGLAFPFIKEKIEGADIEIIPVEPASCPSLTKGKFIYDLGDVAGMTPYLAMYTLGHTFMPHPMHAGGLRYHGMSPLVSQAAAEGLLSPSAVPQLECFEAAVTFARSEGIIVAPETSHALAQVIREARKAAEEGKEKVILFGLSGHGLLDMQGYADYFAGKLSNLELSEAEIEKALARLPKLETVG
ncbi:Tryptophan synthase beta chain 2 [uncultured spirochete]|uniref:Tryptophan synthase beta chain n=1 Tax=uncultured spirochete TaxID=156406 RepID=A0A3P3XQ38_9SPIR|nr:Tryptophan synthase beta chain 2 [uncultured spirochete]